MGKNFQPGEAMKGIQAVVLDLDGTLLNSRREITERSLRAVLDCHAKGIGIIIATARPLRSVRMLLPEALLNMGCLICYNGAHTIDSAHAMEEHTMIDQTIVSELYHCLAVRVPDLLISFEAEGAIFSDRQPRAEQLAVFGVPDNAPLPQALTREEIANLRPYKLLFANENNIYAELAERFSHRVKVIVTDNQKLVQIMNASVSKAAALHNVLQRRGFDPARIMVFGDDYNDLELFELCGFPVAMGNAIDELKQRAAHMTETNDQDGVAIALETLLLS
jgi:Cof subfamily protein (haloacid dehalogenase superfamily)